MLNEARYSFKRKAIIQASLPPFILQPIERYGCPHANTVSAFLLTIPLLFFKPGPAFIGESSTRIFYLSVNITDHSLTDSSLGFAISRASSTSRTRQSGYRHRIPVLPSSGAHPLSRTWPANSPRFGVFFSFFMTSFESVDHSLEHPASPPMSTAPHEGKVT